MATSSAQRALSANQNIETVSGDVEDAIAKTKTSAPDIHPNVLAKPDLCLAIAEISNPHRCSEVMSLKEEVEAQHDALIMPSMRFVTGYGTPSAWYRRMSIQGHSTTFPKRHRDFEQVETEHIDPAVEIDFSNCTGGVEGRVSKCEFARNRQAVRGEWRTRDLLAEIVFLRQRLCSLLLRPVVRSAGREQTGTLGVDAGTDIVAAEAEVPEQSVNEQRSEKGSDPGESVYPMTAGHVEIQAVNEAVKKVSHAVLSLKNVIKDMPSQCSQEHQPISLDVLEDVCQSILQVPDCLTSLLVQRKAELESTSKDRDAAAEALRATEEKMAAAESKRTELVVAAKALERDKSACDKKMKEAVCLLQAVETREKLVAGRERRVVRMEEEQAFEDLNHGANAAMEDEAEAAAAEARESERSPSPNTGSTTAAVTSANLPADLEQIPTFPPAEQNVLLRTSTTLAAKAEVLWHRENHLAFRETTLQHRETALFAREQLLARMKTAQIQLAENWKAQVDASRKGFEAEREDLRARFAALIALKGRVEEMRGRVRNLLGEARGVVRGGGGGGG
ncbi:hypothetical protein IMSHALPRED_007736 [Imshaugia aleurites]|uniref:Uncharacterized protein n=1 Tax=Imshaugia aleurites TaxID=172621 RepID=A0A8H3FQ68_9LECA|nr:hypothetical protein IMSHALPRED_007736 [Imshaugia aleurites]